MISRIAGMGVGHGDSSEEEVRKHEYDGAEFHHSDSSKMPL